jgi:crotonobetainyl-CoA:carnitine CoA-transferase CaiB-like acyl-CoA transferase
MDDDADPKKPKRLSAREKWKNLCDALAEDALRDDEPPSNQERESIERARAKLSKMVEKSQSEDWKKRAKKKKPPGSGYVM